jgi:hypothetical protein
LAKDEYGQLSCRAMEMSAIRYSSRVADQRFHERRDSELDALKKISHENKFAKALKINSD